MKRDQRRPSRTDKDLQPPKAVRQLDDNKLEQITGGGGPGSQTGGTIASQT